MSIINNGLLLASGADAATTYQISRSLRFNSADSAYLERVASSAGDRAKWTLSFWIKRTKLGTSQDIFSAGTSGTDILYFTSGDALALDRPGATVLTTTQVFRDVAAWYHIVLTVDAANGTNSNKAKLYVNGSEITAYSTDNRSGVGSTSFLTNTATTHRIGVRSSNNTVNPCDMYLADVYLLDGTTTDPSTFAQTDAVTGQWVPKTPASISYGTNGFRLSLSDNSGTTSTTLGKDAAGSNNWTPNNFSVASGSGNDSLVDSPSSYGTDTGAGSEVRGNYATLNPLWCNSAITLSNGNLDLSSTSTAWKSVSSTVAIPTSGKWYFEVLQTVATDYLNVGVVPVGFTLSSYPGSTATSWAWQSHANKWNNNTGTSWGSTTTNGDIIMIAVDRDSGKIWAGKNGTWFSSGNPASGTNEMFSGLGSELLVPAIGAYSTTSCAMNFGQRAFAYTAPSGFKALCDTNLPAPVVAKPSTVFDAKLWTGNGSGQTVSGLGFSPDLVWIKQRSTARHNWLFDAVRGAGLGLRSDTTNSENTNDVDGYLSAFTSDGFSYAAGTTSILNVGGNTGTYVAWAWDAGSSNATNTQGSITSQVRANASAGFSIVTYTGTLSGNGNATVGHGLGVAPQLVITKARSATSRWAVQMPTALSANNYLELNTTAAQSSWGTQTRANPTSTVFDTIYAGGVNESGVTYVAYCFAPVAGYTSMGSYVGDGSTSGFGPYIHCGFKPKFVLIKGSSVAYSWLMFDSVRNPYNLTTQVLYADSSTAEMTNNGTGSGGYESIDILSNGFQIKSNSSRYNQSGATYIYFAVAESPFQYSRAR